MLEAARARPPIRKLRRLIRSCCGKVLLQLTVHSVGFLSRIRTRSLPPQTKVADTHPRRLLHRASSPQGPRKSAQRRQPALTEHEGYHNRPHGGHLDRTRPGRISQSFIQTAQDSDPRGAHQHPTQTPWSKHLGQRAETSQAPQPLRQHRHRRAHHPTPPTGVTLQTGHA